MTWFKKEEVAPKYDIQLEFDVDLINTLIDIQKELSNRAKYRKEVDAK